MMNKFILTTVLFFGLLVNSYGETVSSSTTIKLTNESIAVFMNIVPKMNDELSEITNVIADDSSIEEMHISFTTYLPLLNKLEEYEQPKNRIEEFFVILLSYPVLVFYKTLDNLVKNNPKITLSDDPKKLLDALLKHDKAMAKNLGKSEKDDMLATINLMQNIKNYTGEANFKILASHEQNLTNFFTQNQ